MKKLCFVDGVDVGIDGFIGCAHEMILDSPTIRVGIDRYWPYRALLETVSGTLTSYTPLIRLICGCSLGAERWKRFFTRPRYFRNFICILQFSAPALQVGSWKLEPFWTVGNALLCFFFKTVDRRSYDLVQMPPWMCACCSAKPVWWLFHRLAYYGTRQNSAILFLSSPPCEMATYSKT